MNKPPIVVEFINSLKNPWAEELVDLVFFRPIAFLFVKIVHPLPVTPNQISLAAMAMGVAAGIALSGGDRLHFIIGAVFYGFANILDCSDGMIARLKRNGTITGRIVDGCVDYVANIAVYIGFAIGLNRAVHWHWLQLPCDPWILTIAAAASFSAHAVMSDKYRNAFLLQNRQSDRPMESEFDKFKSELLRLEGQPGHWFDKNLIRIYLRYLHLQSAGARPDNNRSIPKQSQRIYPLMMVLWNCIGPSTHIAALILFSFLYDPMKFFIFVIGAANLWMILLMSIQANYHRQRHR